MTLQSLEPTQLPPLAWVIVATGAALSWVIDAVARFKATMPASRRLSVEDLTELLPILHAALERKSDDEDAVVP